ncbi:hypothetical protein LCGC14_3022120, partial [marine sediment metagenome]
MEAKELERMVASAELRNPKVFNASRERYIAEISFKAGYKYALEGAVMNGGYESVKKAGIREVVEWLRENGGEPDHILDKWEAKLKEEADEKAQGILSQAIQRSASEIVAETTVATVPLPNDEMKGRLIGREGRNIRALEQATGVDLIIDDTPEAVTLSSFDPVRREVARLALNKLILDGRIHPARIEEVGAKTK